LVGRVVRKVESDTGAAGARQGSERGGDQSVRIVAAIVIVVG